MAARRIGCLGDCNRSAQAGSGSFIFDGYKDLTVRVCVRGMPGRGFSGDQRPLFIGGRVLTSRDGDGCVKRFCLNRRWTLICALTDAWQAALHQVLLYGFVHHIDGIVHAEFFHDVKAVGLDRAEAFAE